ncbi:restriction endonuclease subunit S [Streptomyces sp. NPDC056227]|uniref:restriction endonuclease subunit S n=1 Tax=Streptomyces sp. NPDC056227 TaxID=3345753 RepID=UPI0035DAE434
MTGRQWQSLNIGKLGRVVTGSTPRTGDDAAWGDLIDFITPTEMSYSNRETSECRKLSASGMEALQRRIIPAGSTLFTCIGFSTGKVAQIFRPAITNQQINALIPNPSVVDERFAYYLLRYKSADIRAIANGSTTPIVNKSMFQAFDVLLPFSEEQAAIADVLGALDDKIAVNERIAATARSLIHVKGFQVIRGLSGDVSPLGEYVDITKGLSYRSADLAPGGGYLVTLKCINRTGVFQQRGLKPFSGTAKLSQMVKHGDVVVAQTDLTQQAEVLGRSTRIVSLNGQDRLIASLDLAVVRPKTLLTREYLDVLFGTREFREHVLSYANGTTVLHLNSRAIPEFTFPVPDEAIVAAVTQVTRSLFDVAVQAEREAASLSALRDTLLPQLMSGRLRVKDAEKIVEDHT